MKLKYLLNSDNKFKNKETFRKIVNDIKEENIIFFDYYFDRYDHFQKTEMHKYFKPIKPVDFINADKIVNFILVTKSEIYIIVDSDKVSKYFNDKNISLYQTSHHENLKLFKLMKPPFKINEIKKILIAEDEFFISTNNEIFDKYCVDLVNQQIEKTNNEISLLKNIIQGLNLKEEKKITTKINKIRNFKDHYITEKNEINDFYYNNSCLLILSNENIIHTLSHQLGRSTHSDEMFQSQITTKRFYVTKRISFPFKPNEKIAHISFPHILFYPEYFLEKNEGYIKIFVITDHGNVFTYGKNFFGEMCLGSIQNCNIVRKESDYLDDHKTKIRNVSIENQKILKIASNGKFTYLVLENGKIYFSGKTSEKEPTKPPVGWEYTLKYKYKDIPCNIYQPIHILKEYLLDISKLKDFFIGINDELVTFFDNDLEVLDHNKYNYSEFVPAKSPKTLINFD
jgi:alpha-tubulin suppressor-like RCC1 family protein